MPWIIAALVILLILGLTRIFIINARTLRRDMTARVDGFRARLEHEANAVVDHILDATPADDERLQ